MYIYTYITSRNIYEGWSYSAEKENGRKEVVFPMKSNKNQELGLEGANDASSAGKTRITIRLDSEIIDWFRSQVEAKGGGNYQTMINNALRDYLNQGGEPLESVLRRVIREELRNVGSESEAPPIPRGRL
jgi:uncharacterized protein (DUF4415 family)